MQMPEPQKTPTQVKSEQSQTQEQKSNPNQVQSPASNPTSVPLTKDEDKAKTPNPERPKTAEEIERLGKDIDRERSPEEKEKMELLRKIGDIAKDYGGLEANIPLTHEYWNLLNQYRYKKY
jgi:hypothetical protein